MHVVYNIRVTWYLVVIKGKNREHSVIAVAHYTAYRIISDRRIVWELLVAIGPTALEDNCTFVHESHRYKSEFC